MANPTWREELEQAFVLFDGDANGKIDKKEFGSLLDELGSSMSERDREIGFALVDKDGDGTITVEELADWWEIVRDEAAG